MSMPAEKKAATEKAMVIGLLIIFGATLARGPVTKMLKAAAPVPAALPLAQPAASTAPAGDAPAQQAQTTASTAGKTYTAYEFRDPFANQFPAAPPAVAMAQAEPENPTNASPMFQSQGANPMLGSQLPLQVEGVLLGDGSKSQAIINGDVYGINDVVGDLRIVAINRRGVAVDRGGEPVYLTFPTASGNGDEGRFLNNGQ